MNNGSGVLESLGLSSEGEAAKVLFTLLRDKVVSLDQIQESKKKVLSNSEKTKGLDNSSGIQKNTKGVNDRYMTRHIALRFHYDGATYNGLAQNVNVPDDNSVEKVLFAALQKTCLISSRSECGYSRSGRTDKGVSAFGQVVALRVRSAFPIGSMTEGDTLMQEDDLPKNSMQKVKCMVPVKPKKQKNKKKKSENEEETTETSVDESKMVEKVITEKDFAQSINNVLPNTIRVLGWSPVSDGFSSRFSTKSRTYRYFFVRRDLDLSAMEKGLDNMKGRHDFRNMCKMNCEEVDNFERVFIYGKIVTTAKRSDEKAAYADYTPCSTSSEPDGSDTYRQICYFEIKGQAFLWHQIRCIASVLFMIGKGLESPDIVTELLDIKKNPGKPNYPFAPDLPLVLHRCEYGNLRLGHSVKNLWRVCCDLESKWEELVLASERLKNGLFSIRDEAEVSSHDVVDFVNGVLAEKKKKQRKYEDLFGAEKSIVLPELKSDEHGIVSWNVALAYIFECTKLKPASERPTVQLHIPLMQRGRGTTYEEKIQAILSTDNTDGKGSSKRRREIYEQNIIKKKVSKEEDKAFYSGMAVEGGSGF
mmetsp:Transcript_7260/g.10350  ORF Transcript_7260/g.10350 Transcript_7260/m.10350 type:complete len:589 (-) Transcript_7260:65-1831(-)|eukprot:CAMPEP_0194087480 /NCGR_PEP_ID=MMETSP0149-20130528/25203_1 /TAXON_ID=122233 /ORGANISM="Chaetoceros debilis, Strain MM31A-1" /LENGTH=588 /DNA_ID=CAMNT_0038770841 /DNA_START=90 /DNA_END=1856 /DNA_ORIENTATION=-